MRLPVGRPWAQDFERYRTADKLPATRGSRFRHDVALKVKNALNNNRMFFVITQDRYTPDAGREVELNLTTRF